MLEWQADPVKLVQMSSSLAGMPQILNEGCPASFRKVSEKCGDRILAIRSVGEREDEIVSFLGGPLQARIAI